MMGVPYIDPQTDERWEHSLHRQRLLMSSIFIPYYHPAFTRLQAVTSILYLSHFQRLTNLILPGIVLLASIRYHSSLKIVLFFRQNST